MLAHFGLVTPYGDVDLCQHWLRLWLVAWWHQAITLTNISMRLVSFCDIRPREISQQVTITVRSLKVILLELLPHLPEANELIDSCEIWHDAMPCQISRWYSTVNTPSCGFETSWGLFGGLVQERRNSRALAMELRLSCTNPLFWSGTLSENETDPRLSYKLCVCIISRKIILSRYM